jgi:adenosylcobinamide-GDP ribazoletransferase
LRLTPPPINDNHAVADEEPHLAADLVMGLRFYSRLPTGKAPHAAPRLERIALALPFASLVIGLGPALALLALLVAGTPPLFAATVAVALTAIVTGAMAEDALADAADGLFGGRDAGERLDIMRDSRHGTYGVVAIVLYVALRVTAIGAIGNALEAAGVLLAAALLARSGALWLAHALPPARSGGAAASVGPLSRRNFAVGAGFAALLSFVLAGFAVGVAGLVAALALAALVAWGWVTVCRRLVGGQTGDLIGALQALLEAAVLTAFMIFM